MPKSAERCQNWPVLPPEQSVRSVFPDYPFLVTILLRTAILRSNPFVLTGQDYIHSMRDFQSKPICSQFNLTFVVLERSLHFDKTREVVNNALT